ncbi:hypothetical protein PCE1_001824 [Barthelona sp. PCE]
MPRIRKFEDDLIIGAFPEGQIIFEGQGVRMVKTREDTHLHNLIDAVDGEEFCGYVEETCESLQYYYKRKAGAGYMIVEQHFSENNRLTDLEILYFNEINSDEHTNRKIRFPFDDLDNLQKYVSSEFVPLDENHIFFSIAEVDEEHQNGESTHCYILNILTEQYRCLGEYYHYSTNSNCSIEYVLMSNYENDFSIFHYNFCVDDMDEAHEPDIVQLEGVHNQNCIGCYNADCVCFYVNGEILEELIIFDRQRNRVDLLERFPQLLELKMSYCSYFALFTLTQDVFSALLNDGSICTVVHIENGELKSTTGDMASYIANCVDLKHIDLANSFHNEQCQFFGTSNATGVYGPIKFRKVNNEVIRLQNFWPLRVMYDGTAHFADSNMKRQCYFYFKEKRIVTHKSVMTNDSFMFERNYSELSMHPVEEEYFFMIAQCNTRLGASELVKIHWEGSESKPIITPFENEGFLNYNSLVLGLPFFIEYNENFCQGYLGNTKVLELPPNEYINNCMPSVTGSSMCVICTNSTHFLQLLINNNDVEVQKHITFHHGDDVSSLVFCHHPLTDTADHQLFVTYKYNNDGEEQYLHCLDWSTGNFLEPVLIYKYLNDGEMDEEFLEGNCFFNFIGDSYIQVDQGINKVSIVNGVIEMRFYTNTILPNIGNDIRSLNMPNNVVQEVIYEEETKTMVLKTYNVEEDPESTNPTVERFHLPSFLAEASVVEYHMPNYHSQTNNEAEFL